MRVRQWSGGFSRRSRLERHGGAGRGCLSGPQAAGVQRTAGGPSRNDPPLQGRSGRGQQGHARAPDSRASGRCWTPHRWVRRIANGPASETAARPIRVQRPPVDMEENSGAFANRKHLNNVHSKGWDWMGPVPSVTWYSATLIATNITASRRIHLLYYCVKISDIT